MRIKYVNNELLYNTTVAMMIKVIYTMTNVNDHQIAFVLQVIFIFKMESLSNQMNLSLVNSA